MCPIPLLGTPTPTDWPPTHPHRLTGLPFGAHYPHPPTGWPPTGHTGDWPTLTPLPTRLPHWMAKGEPHPSLATRPLPFGAPTHTYRLTGHPSPTTPGLPFGAPYPHRLDGQRVGDWPPTHHTGQRLRPNWPKGGTGHLWPKGGGSLSRC